MPTSTNRPKPKPGQPAGKQPTGKEDKEQATNGATQPLAKKDGESIAAAAKSTTGSTQPAAKTSGSLQPEDAKSNGSAEPAAKTTSGSLDSAAKTASETSQPAAKSSGSLQSPAKASSGKLESGAKAGTTSTQPAAKTSGSIKQAAKTGASPQASARTAKTTGSLKATPKASKAAPQKPQTSAREQKREARRDEISRRIEERRQQREKEQRNRALRRWAIIGGGTLLVLGVAAIIAYQIISGLNLPAYARGVTIDGIDCNTSEQLIYHYHAHLAIYVDGKPVSIPDDVGRQDPNCYYWLHTHQITGDDGVIHIESPDSRTYQIYQFFDIWGQTFTGSNFLGHPIDKTHTLTAYVYNPPQSDVNAHNQAVQQAQQQNPNGPLPSFTVTPTSGLKPYTGDPRKIQLKAYELIVLEYGTPLVPPQPFSFRGGE